MDRTLIHPSLLFRFETSVQEAAGSVNASWTLDDRYTTPNFLGLDGQRQQAEVRFAIGWSPNGLFLQWVVRSLTAKLPANLSIGRLRFWIDSRGSIGIHRLTATCTQFEFRYDVAARKVDVTAYGAGRAKPAAEDDPIAAAGLLSRLESAKDSFTVRSFVPATAMPGYQPDEFPNVSYFFDLVCGDGSQIPVSVGTQLKYDIDPGLWIRAVLRPKVSSSRLD